MVVLAEINEFLRRWDKWKRVEEAPDRIDALERRIAELEEKLKRAPGEACPSCGALDFRTIESADDSLFGMLGGKRKKLKCGSCGFEDERLTK